MIQYNYTVTSKILNPSLCLSSYKHDGFLWATITIVLGVSTSCKSGQCLLMQDKFRVPVVVQSLSRVWLFATPWTAAWQVSLSFTISWSLLKLMSVESMMPSNYLIFCCPLLLSSMFPASRSFQMSELFTSGGQSIGASGSVLPMNIQGWFPLGLTGVISLLSKRLFRVFSSTTVKKHQFFSTKPSLWSNSHIHTRLLETP